MARLLPTQFFRNPYLYFHIQPQVLVGFTKLDTFIPSLYLPQQWQTISQKISIGDIIFSSFDVIGKNNILLNHNNQIK